MNKRSQKTLKFLFVARVEGEEDKRGEKVFLKNFFGGGRGCTSAKHWVSFALHQATTQGATCASRAEWGRRIGPRPGSPTPTAKGSENDRPQTLSPASPSTHYTPKFELQLSLGDLPTNRTEIAAERKRRTVAAEAPPLAGAARDYLAPSECSTLSPGRLCGGYVPAHFAGPRATPGAQPTPSTCSPPSHPHPHPPRAGAGAPARPSRPSTRRALLTQLAQAALR